MAFLKAIGTFVGSLGIGFWVKTLAVAAVVTASTTFAWKYRGAVATNDQRVAVDAAKEDVTTKYETVLTQERQVIVTYQKMADEQYAQLNKTLTDMQAQFNHLQITLTTELASNPKFYTQPLPKGGYDIWMASRKLLLDAQKGGQQ